jgi:hypothetical protein
MSWKQGEKLLHGAAAALLVSSVQEKPMSKIIVRVQRTIFHHLF